MTPEADLKKLRNPDADMEKLFERFPGDRCSYCGKKRWACLCPPERRPLGWWQTRGKLFDLFRLRTGTVIKQERR